MQEFQENKYDLFKRLNTSEAFGLSSEQVEKNRDKYGNNVFIGKKPASLFKRIVTAAGEPVNLMLIVAGIIALAVNSIRASMGSQVYLGECAGLLAAIFLSVTISVIMAGKKSRAFEVLSDIRHSTAVKARRNGDTLMLCSEELVVGDIVLLSTGDRIPADGRLLQSCGPAADEKILISEGADMLYYGNYITSGHVKMVVTAVGVNTELGRIAEKFTKIENSATPLQEKLTRLGKTVTILGIIPAAIIFISELISFALMEGLVLDQILEAFDTSIVLIVASVPEGLTAVAAVSLWINIIRLSRQNALVKKMIAFETVGCTNVICTDKTGILTENKMTVSGFYDKKWHEEAGDLSSEWLANNICLNTTAEILQDGTFIGSPSECAMLNFYERSEMRRSSRRSCQDKRSSHDVLQNSSFSSKLKHITAVSKADGKIILYVKGNPECVLFMCALSDGERLEVEHYITKSQEKAMQVCAFAHKELDQMEDYVGVYHHAAMETDMVFDGFAAISDPLHADAYEAVKNCYAAGIDLKILTEDNIVTAKAIAKELHILSRERLAVDAEEINNMNDDELLKLLPRISVIARSTSAIKIRLVKLLKSQRNVVAVTGDGIQDVPALKNADIGIAMGISGSEVSKEAGDIVLLDDSFSTIVKTIVWGRGIYENFKRFIQFQLTVNVSSVIVIFASILLGLKVPFTALQLLWINIIMAGPPALALGLEPIYDGLMDRKPVKRSDNIISRTLLIRTGMTGLYISVIFLGQYQFNFLHAAEGEISTVLFALFALFQLFHGINCSELHTTSIFKHLLQNRIMLTVSSVTIILQVLVIQYAGALLGTVPLELIMWLKLLCLSLSVVVISEVVKLCKRIKIKFTAN